VVVKNSSDKQLVNKINDIIQNPDKHLHDYNGLFDCCFHDGLLNSQLLDAHSWEE